MHIKVVRIEHFDSVIRICRNKWLTNAGALNSLPPYFGRILSVLAGCLAPEGRLFGWRDT